MDAVEVFNDPDDDLDPIQGIRLPKSS